MVHPMQHSGAQQYCMIIDTETNTVHSDVTLPIPASPSTVKFWSGPTYDAYRDLDI